MSWRMKFRVMLLTAVFLLLMQLATAQEEIQTVAIQSITVSPNKLFVGDVAEVTLTLYNPNTQSVRVSSVQIDGDGISSTDFLDVGYIPPQSTHHLQFSIKALESGTQDVRVKVYSGSKAVYTTFTIYVEEKPPEISLDSNVRLGEVNEVSIVVSTPLKIEKVVIDPLFDSEPERIYIAEISETAKAPIKFYASQNESYEFSISFYNSGNYHSYTVKLIPAFEESKGLFVGISMPCTSAYLYDVLPVTLNITNLRDDPVFSIRIEASSQKGVFSENREIAMLKPGESESIHLFYSPEHGGEDVLRFTIHYKDEFGNEGKITKELSLEILNKPAVDIAGVEIETKSSSSPQPKGLFRPSPATTAKVEISVSGDVSNNGFGKIRGVYVYLDFGEIRKDYYIGSIEPSEAESFSIPATGSERSVKVTVEWMNELGMTKSITKEYQLTSTQPITRAKATNPLLSPYLIGGLAIALVIVGYFLHRRRKK
ncbi:MAG: hypothetical protein H0Z28_07395 [Archaeoglobus sp.]|nr:hypothetical protein [Archaeoglobus sp.]